MILNFLCGLSHHTGGHKFKDETCFDNQKSVNNAISAQGPNLNFWQKWLHTPKSNQNLKIIFGGKNCFFICQGPDQNPDQF